MTSGVKQALPQILMPKPNADRQALRNRANDRDFGEALGIAKKGRQEISGKLPVDAEQRWPRFGTKLDAAIDRTSGLGSKLSLKIAEPEQPDARQASDEETLAQDDARKPAATEDADTAISLPLPAIHIPPVQARRTSDTDGEEPAPHDAQANEKNGHIVATAASATDDMSAALLQSTTATATMSAALLQSATMASPGTARSARRALRLSWTSQEPTPGLPRQRPSKPRSRYSPAPQAGRRPTTRQTIPWSTRTAALPTRQRSRRA